MSAPNAHSRFLLRGTTLLAGLLLLWWLTLFDPLLYLLRQSANQVGALIPGAPPRWITESAGGWTIEVPLNAVIPASPERPVSVNVHSIDFDLARSDAGAFTFGLPVYWAIVLAGGEARRALRPLLLGTLTMWLAEIAMLLLYVELFAHKTAASWTPSQDAMTSWFYRYGDYLLVSVIPYVAPLVVALWLHSGLRGQILLLGARRLLPWSRLVASAPSSKKA